MKTEQEINDRIEYLKARRQESETLKESHMYTDMLTELLWVLT